MSFFLLVPRYGTLGAAFSILIAFVSSSALSLIWSERASIRYIVTSAISIIAGVISGYVIGLIVVVYPIEIFITSIGVTLIVIFALKNTSPNEIRQLVKGMINRK
jgi:ribose/xylose/arabinose/galactoside ABC-type transport system permease subunit